MEPFGQKQSYTSASEYRGGRGGGKAPGDGVALGNWSALNNWGEDLTVQLWAEGAEDFLPAAIVDKVNKHEQIITH